MLKHLGHEVVTANLPSQALAMAERSSAGGAAGGPGFDLVISDITMPEMNGHQLAARLRQLWPQVPVLFMTGYDSHMAEAGASAPFIPKPLSLRSLADGIAKMLAGSHLA
jgi:CheY-like chemotaxis protein